MDSAFGLQRDDHLHEDVVIEAPPPVVGGAERRLHVRAFELWASLLAGRPLPSIGDLDHQSFDEFEPRSVLLAFPRGLKDPQVARIGHMLREECAAADNLRSLADVPRGSLLSRLTDHYLEIIGTRAPIGFEAEFTNSQGMPTLYRGILMPFSTDGIAIDHVLGVINWKHALSADLADALRREMTDLAGWRDALRH